MLQEAHEWDDKMMERLNIELAEKSEERQKEILMELIIKKLQVRLFIYLL